MQRLDVQHRLGVGFSVSDGATELVRYTYTPDARQLEAPKPYLHPLRTRAGNTVTIHRPHDHPWHAGLTWSLPVVGEENFWGGPTFTRGQGYVQRPNNGTQRHRRIAEFEGADAGMRFAHELDWMTQGGRRVVSEMRALDVRLLDGDAWMLLFDTTMTNVSGESITFGSPTTRGRKNAGYGGLFWRGPRSFTGGTVVTAEATGGDDLRGSRGEWMAFAGRHDGADGSSLVLMLDAADNPRHPTQWFARSDEYAAVNPAPFFSEELALPAGDSVRFAYGVGVADGVPADAPALAAAVRSVLAERSASLP